MSTRFSSLAYPDVRRYLSARFLVGIAVQMQTVAVGFQVYETTHNPLDLGLIGLSQFLPFVILVLPAGHIADRYDRRRVILACYLLAAVASALLTAFALLGVTSVLPIFIVMAMFGVVRAFNMPTSQALLPNLVPRAEFGNAVALNTSTMQIATIAGPAVAGLLILVGTEVVYATVTVLILISAYFIWRLRAGGSVDTDAAEPMTMRSLLSGVRFVRDHKPILGSMSLDLFAVLFGGATALLPAFAVDVLHVGPVGLGFLRAAPAVGAALAGGMLALRPVRTSVGRWLFGGVFVFGISIVVFGLSQLVLDLARRARRAGRLGHGQHVRAAPAGAAADAGPHPWPGQRRERRLHRRLERAGRVRVGRDGRLVGRGAGGPGRRRGDPGRRRGVDPPLPDAVAAGAFPGRADAD